MKNMKIPIIIIAVLIVVFFMMGPYYILEEGQQAVVRRLGKVVNTETEAGFKFKLPVADDVIKYPKRIQSWDGDAKRLPTEENQFIFVDTTARWQITDVKLFYSRVKTIPQAQSRLDDIIDSTVRKVIASSPLREAVRNSNVINEIERKNVFQGQGAGADSTKSEEDRKSLIASTFTKSTYESVVQGRVMLSDEMLKVARENVKEFGVTLIDIIIRQIKYSDDLTQSVYNRMIKERNQIAQAFRSDGEGEKAKWLGKREKELRSIRSGAERTAKEIKAKADQKALEVRNQAYEKDIDFADFWMALQQYQKILPKMNKILTTDFEFFKYLYKKSGK